ncbi:MAG: ribonuclease HI [Treponema sp.]|nr:ribonuclease HI [Treponema sp.]
MESLVEGTIEPSIEIYTDGGCSGNPGPGGWAFIAVLHTGFSPSDFSPPVLGPKVLAERYGSEKQTTNNRMELLAVINSLKAIYSMPGIPRTIVVYTDSQYVQKGISEWIKKWKLNAWRTSDKKPVKNQDLWKELDALSGEFSITWKWIRGHSGIEYNERCDLLTQQAIKEAV